MNPLITNCKIQNNTIKTIIECQPGTRLPYTLINKRASPSVISINLFKHLSLNIDKVTTQSYSHLFLYYRFVKDIANKIIDQYKYIAVETWLYNTMLTNQITEFNLLHY